MKTWGINSAGLIYFISAVIVAGCGNNAPAVEKKSKMKGINIYTEVLEFPDPDAAERSSGSGPSDDHERFAEKAGKAYNELIARYAGNPPLDGPEKIKFAKEMMTAQALILFDMKLGPSHAARDKFLETVHWCFDRRQVINEKRQKMLDKGMKFHIQADAEFRKETANLLSETRAKLKKILGRDYGRLTGEN